MSQGEHKEGYERPRTGEKRQVRQPFSIDKFPDQVRDTILQARAQGMTWAETAAEASRVAGKEIPVMNIHRWYDNRVAQTSEAVTAAQEIAKVFAGQSFAKLAESVKTALAAQIFQLSKLTDEKNRARFAKQLESLGWLLAELNKSDVAEKKLALDAKHLQLEVEKFELARRKLEKLTNDAAQKLGEGKSVTLADINRIRDRAFGLPPIQRSGAASHPA